MVCHGFADMNGEDLNVLHSAGARNSRIIKSIIEGSYSDAIDYQATRWNSTWTTNAVDEANFKMLQRSYETCMDTESISKAGSQPLVNLIATLNTIWPHTEDLKAKLSPSDYDGLSKATFFLEEMGISPFVKLGVQSDYFAPVRDCPFSFGHYSLCRMHSCILEDTGAQASCIADECARTDGSSSECCPNRAHQLPKYIDV